MTKEKIIASLDSLSGWGSSSFDVVCGIARVNLPGVACSVCKRKLVRGHAVVVLQIVGQPDFVVYDFFCLPLKYHTLGYSRACPTKW